MNDVAVARNAGVKVVAVTFGYTTIAARELGADCVIDRFDELGAIVGLQ
jgi:phosphoglycolate phosphatase